MDVTNLPSACILEFGNLCQLTIFIYQMLISNFCTVNCCLVMLNKIIDLFIYGQSNTSSTLNLEVLHTNYLVIIKNECVHSPLIFFAHLMVLYAIYDHDEVSENEIGR